LIPAHNEAENLPIVLKSVKKLMPDSDILIVDDGSEDDTAQVAETNGALVVKLPYNMGYGAAVQTGYHYAIDNGYERLLQMDADGQHRPEDAASLLRVLEEKNADIVLGCRFMPGSGDYEMPFLRRFGQAYLRFFVRLLTGKQFADPTTGFQAVSRRAIRLYAQDVFPTDYPDADVLVMLCKAGMKVEQQPVTMKQRMFGMSMHSGLKWVYYLFRMTLALLVIALGRQFKPMIQEGENGAVPSVS
jgi:glycosyltransferase involved in cell wall biosynthesis